MTSKDLYSQQEHSQLVITESDPRSLRIVLIKESRMTSHNYSSVPLAKSMRQLQRRAVTYSDVAVVMAAGDVIIEQQVLSVRVVVSG